MLNPIPARGDLVPEAPVDSTGFGATLISARNVSAHGPLTPPDKATAMLNAQVNAIARALTQGLRRILGDKLYAAVIYGAAAFPDAVPTGDIDFHVILTAPLTEHERSQLDALHTALARDFPPLGAEMDGYYILLADARGATPPQSQMWSGATDFAWALHRAHMLAGRCIVLHGPDPRDTLLPPAWAELEAALDAELAFVEEHLSQYPDYCILQLCRLIYSNETRKVVVSKAHAAAWAWEDLPQWRPAIAAARRSYAREATPADRELMRAELPALYTLAVARIARAREQDSTASSGSGNPL